MPISPQSVLITGANRGIGLELVKQITKLPNAPKQLIATCRNITQAKELNDIAKSNSSVKVIQLDVTAFSAIPNFVCEVERILGDWGLNLLINNAGINIRSSLDDITPDEMNNVMETNCTAPLILTQSLLPLLRKASNLSSLQGMTCNKCAIVNISSVLGSIQANGSNLGAYSGGLYAYRSSKAALNAVTKSLSIDLAKDDILAVVFHPGWVRTDMGGPNGEVDVQTSAQGMLSVMAELDEKKTGVLWDFRGNKLPW